MKHIEEIQIAGTALLLCGAMFAVSAVAPNGESISKAVTNFTEAPETAAEAQARQKPPLKMPALPFILRKAIMITITMMTLVMTAPTMTHPMTTPLPVRFSRMIRIPTQEIREALTVTLLLMLIPEIRTPLMFPMIQG